MPTIMLSRIARLLRVADYRVSLRNTCALGAEFAARWAQGHNITHPLNRFSRPGFSATKRVPTPNDTFSDSSRRDLSHDTLFEVETLVVAEKLGLGNRFRGFLTVCHVRYCAVKEGSNTLDAGWTRLSHVRTCGFQHSIATRTGVCPRLCAAEQSMPPLK